MDHFNFDHFNSSSGGSGTFPDEGDVRDGTVYGPTDNLTGSAVDIAQPLADLATNNLSAFESSALQSLSVFFDHQGVPADYISGATTTRIQVIVERQYEQRESIDEERKLREHLEVLVRRDVITAPAAGDKLVLKQSNGTRRYTLTRDPQETEGQLEWLLEFSRTVSDQRGGLRAFPVEGGA